MSCDTAKNFNHLTVESCVDVGRCAIGRGNAASHRVTLRNYAPLEVEVEITCACPPRGELEYSSGKSWRSESVQLDEMGIGGGGNTSFPFYEDLSAAVGGTGRRSEQLQLEVRRRRLPAGSWKAFPRLALKAIDVS
jgi:hypothetical protein